MVSIQTVASIVLKILKLVRLDLMNILLLGLLDNFG